MSPTFSNYFVRNGLVVDFHGLDASEQHLALESNAQLSILLHALQCNRHSDFTLSVHLAFMKGQLQNTIFCCCGGCRKEVALALLASTFPSFCYRPGNRRTRSVRVRAQEL
jgi:hypothetical protein